MEDLVLILSMAALFAFGLIPVIKLDQFVRKHRIFICEPERPSHKARRCSGNDLELEFENNGVVYFDLPCDPGQIDSTDLKRVE